MPVPRGCTRVARGRIRAMNVNRFLILAAALVASAGCAQAQAEPGTIAFVNVNLLPMDQAGVVANQTVVVVNGVVTQVGSSNAVSVGTGATIIDGAGRYLMPGLAEMHAHVPSGANPSREAVEDILFLYIANGVTTIRGMLGSEYQIPLADELESGSLLGPTFYVGAPSINGTSAPTPADAERLIRDHKAAGYDLQKIHPGVSLETWDHMVAVAGEVGLTYGGHVPSDVGLVHAIETGMSTVDHLDGYVQAVASDDVVSQVNTGQEISLDGLVNGVDEAKIADLVQLTLEHDVYVIPTMYLWANLYGVTDPEPFLSQPEMKYVSSAQRDAWRRQAAPGPRGAPHVVEAFLDVRNRILKDLADAGAGILMGTDSPQMFNVPGFALFREIDFMSDAGMTNQQILESGTLTVGRYVREHLGIDHHFGAVAPGQRADLVLLGSNPLDDLANLTDREGVMVRGRWISRADIDAGLEALAAKHARIP
ncbi:MAG: amidohydrolase family protein [Gemmatimonadetes bacterium]|nr:amidohydrolase family protein [Gemmatimonadota bacterium]